MNENSVTGAGEEAEEDDPLAALADEMAEGDEEETRLEKGTSHEDKWTHYRAANDEAEFEEDTR